MDVNLVSHDKGITQIEGENRVLRGIWKGSNRKVKEIVY
jgi:hypothetical protein